MKQFIKSVGFALNGIRILLKNERNFKIHFILFLIALLLGFLLNITVLEWIVILLTSALVLGMEAINSALENLCDHVTPEQHPTIKSVKDMASGAVLIAAMIALIIGCFIFISPIYQLIF